MMDRETKGLVKLELDARRREAYRHQHQDERPTGSSAETTTTSLGSAATRAVSNFADRILGRSQEPKPASAEHRREVQEAMERSAREEAERPAREAAEKQRQDEVLEHINYLAGAGTPEVQRAKADATAIFDARSPQLKYPDSSMHTMLLSEVIEACNAVWESPTLENHRRLKDADEMVARFEVSFNGPGRHPASARHAAWIAAREQEKLSEKLERGEKLATWPTSFFHEQEAMLGPNPRPEISPAVRLGVFGRAATDAKLRDLMNKLDIAYFRHRDDPTTANLEVLNAARKMVHAHPSYADLSPDVQAILYDVPPFPEAPEPTVVVPIISDQVSEHLEADLSSTQALIDAGISTVLPDELPYCEIWCVYRDRDETLLIGENRRETVMEIALTLHGAFCSLVRMSGFSFEYLEEVHGHTPDDPQLEPLCITLTDLLDDRFHFGPYETTLEARFLNFLQ